MTTFIMLSLMQMQLRLMSLSLQVSEPNIAYADTKPIEKLPPIFDRIGFCESGGISGRQTDEKGKVIIGPTKDIGKYQISQIHLPEAKRLGVDIFSEKGNEAFAFFLYQKNGLRDWSSSYSCWGKFLSTSSTP